MSKLYVLGVDPTNEIVQRIEDVLSGKTVIIVRYSPISSLPPKFYQDRRFLPEWDHVNSEILDDQRVRIIINLSYSVIPDSKMIQSDHFEFVARPDPDSGRFDIAKDVKFTFAPSGKIFSVEERGDNADTNEWRLTIFFATGNPV